jgi:hypothetical protein
MMDQTADSLSNVDVRVSRTKRIIFAAVIAVVVVAGGIVAFKLITNKPGAKACEHLAEMRKTDPLADKVIEKLVRHVQTSVVKHNLVQGVERVQVSGDTLDDRCENAIDKLDQVMGHGPFMRMVDCIATAKTARSAALCF